MGGPRKSCQGLPCLGEAAWLLPSLLVEQVPHIKRVKNLKNHSFSCAGKDRLGCRLSLGYSGTKAGAHVFSPVPLRCTWGGPRVRLPWRRTQRGPGSLAAPLGEWQLVARSTHDPGAHSPTYPILLTGKQGNEVKLAVSAPQPPPQV